MRGQDSILYIYTVRRDDAITGSFWRRWRITREPIYLLSAFTTQQTLPPSLSLSGECGSRRHANSNSPLLRRQTATQHAHPSRTNRWNPRYSRPCLWLYRISIGWKMEYSPLYAADSFTLRESSSCTGLDRFSASSRVLPQILSWDFSFLPRGSNRLFRRRS